MFLVWKSSILLLNSFSRIRTPHWTWLYQSRQRPFLPIPVVLSWACHLYSNQIWISHHANWKQTNLLDANCRVWGRRTKTRANNSVQTHGNEQCGYSWSSSQLPAPKYKRNGGNPLICTFTNTYMASDAMFAEAGTILNLLKKFQRERGNILHKLSNLQNLRSSLTEQYNWSESWRKIYTREFWNSFKVLCTIILIKRNIF